MHHFLKNFRRPDFLAFVVSPPCARAGVTALAWLVVADAEACDDIPEAAMIFLAAASPAISASRNGTSTPSRPPNTSTSFSKINDTLICSHEIESKD